MYLWGHLFVCLCHLCLQTNKFKHLNTVEQLIGKYAKKMIEHILMEPDWFILLLFSMFFISYSLLAIRVASLITVCYTTSRLSLPLFACLTQARLSVWSQDSSRSTAAVGLRTPGTCAVHLITDVIEIWATQRNNLLTRQQRMKLKWQTYDE